MVLKPLRPVRHPGLPAPEVAGECRVRVEDFVVDEIPLYEPSGEGAHTWLRIEKTGVATMPAAEALASSLDVPLRQVGWAGLKDAAAIARQWISFEGVDEDRARAVEVPGVRVLEVRRHGNKLKLGHLRGNRFEIVVRGPGEAELPALQSNLDWLTRHGVPNGFGEQRFGKRGANLEKGLRILHGDPRRAARSVPKRLLRLLVSAVQSEVFNHVLAERMATFDRVVDGDVAWLHRNGACFVVEQAVNERVRTERFEISPSGPLPGPKCLAPRGEPGAIETEVMRALELDPAVFGRVPGGTNEGARRPLRVPLGEPTLELCDGGVKLGFQLPQGAFATSVLRQLLADQPWFA